MPMFIDPNERIAVYEFDANEVISEEPPNVIFIRPKMDFATQKKVGAAGFRLGAGSKPNELDLAENLIAMLVLNIVGWSGPQFDSVPCTPENIRRLDPDQPIVEKALEEIARRNSKAPPDPKAPAGTTTAMSAGAIDSITPPQSISLQLATTPQKLRSHIDSIGRQSKLDD